MAIVWMDGFDHYTDAGSNELNTVEAYTVADPAMTRCQSDNLRFDTGKYLQIYDDTDYFDISIPPTDTIITSFAFRHTNVTVTRKVVVLKYGATIHVELYLAANGTLHFNRGHNGTQIGPTSVQSMTDDTWYWVEVKVLINDSTGTVQCQVNGVDWIASTGPLDTRNGGTTGVNTVRLIGGNSSWSMFDDLVIQDDTGTEAFLGDSRIETFMPNGEGSTIEWTPNTGTDNSALVDEISPDSDTTYVSSATVDHIDYYDVDALTNSDTIHAVGVHFRAKKTDTGARSIESRTKSSTDLQGGGGRAIGTSYANYADVFETTDAGTTAWTKTLFDAAEFGIKVTV